MPITTHEELRKHIELAIKVELTTIPPYLFAMYSIEDQLSEPALLIRSIVAEEMLHAALASNLLLAVGGRPDFKSTRYIPVFPADLPHHVPPLTIDLARCSLEMIEDVFMRIEQPEARGAPAQPDEYETLGQFYHALEIGLQELSESVDLFAKLALDSQMSDPSFYNPVRFDAEDSGGLMLIDGLESAIEAIEIIIHQGEGLSDDRWADPDHQELTHYYKLERILGGDSQLGTVRPLRPNPTSDSYPRHIGVVADLFNACYRYLYFVMDRMFSDDPAKSSHVGRLYRLMTGPMSQLALWLAAQPLADGDHAAPTFEVFEFQTNDPTQEVRALADEAEEAHAELAPIIESARAAVS